MKTTVAGQSSSEIPMQHSSMMTDDALWPGVVIEVAYSQSSKDIPNLADDYSIILETNGRCRRAGYRLQYKKRAQFPYGVRIT